MSCILCMHMLHAHAHAHVHAHLHVHVHAKYAARAEGPIFLGILAPWRPLHHRIHRENLDELGGFRDHTRFMRVQVISMADIASAAPELRSDDESLLLSRSLASAGDRWS